MLFHLPAQEIACDLDGGLGRYPQGLPTWNIFARSLAQAAWLSLVDGPKSVSGGGARDSGLPEVHTQCSGFTANIWLFLAAKSSA